MESLTSYTMTHTLSEIDCDWNGRILPGVLLRLTQQVATAHCEAMGLDRAFYNQHQLAFLMVKVAFQWEQVPCYGQTLHITTQPEMQKRATYKRITTVMDATTGEQLGLVDSRWVLVDVESRRILRRPPEEIATLQFEASLPQELPLVIEKAEQTSKVDDICASYTYCDWNGHMNNSRYADLCCDALPQELLWKESVRAMRISYHRELKAGEKGQIHRAQLADKSWYFTAHKMENDQQVPVFEANVMF